MGKELKPGEAQHFAWDDPAGVRKLSWNCLEHFGELGLVKVTMITSLQGAPFHFYESIKYTN